MFYFVITRLDVGVYVREEKVRFISSWSKWEIKYFFRPAKFIHHLKICLNLKKRDLLRVLKIML